MSEFEKLVKSAMSVKGIKTISELADILGISVSYLSELIRGTRINQDQIDRIKKVLEIE